MEISIVRIGGIFKSSLAEFQAPGLVGFVRVSNLDVGSDLLPHTRHLQSSVCVFLVFLGNTKDGKLS